jgi:hypothetical protein
MYSPECGAENQNVKAYCTRCGEWLPEKRGGKRNTFGHGTPQQSLATSPKTPPNSSIRFLHRNETQNIERNFVSQLLTAGIKIDF